MSADAKYPEHARLREVQGREQVLGKFLEWLESEGIVLAEYGTGDADDDMSIAIFGYSGKLYPILESGRNLLARYYWIDQRKMEAEKQQMIDELREEGGTK